MSYNLKNIKEEFKNKGIFYTPPELALTMKQYVPGKVTNVYDPTCGDGSLLSVFDDEVKKYGQEINEHQLDVAKERLKNFKGVCGDTLQDPAFKGKKFSLIMANYPFSIKWEPNDTDARFIDAPTIPTQSRADYAFILHILHYLSNEGIAVTLNFPGILYRGGREGRIRQWLVESNFIEKIVMIPGDTFVDTTIATVLIVFNKNKINTNIKFEDKGLNIKKTISLEEVRSNDYTLSVSNYIQEEIVVEKIDAVDLEMKARKSLLNKLKKEIEFSVMVAKFEKLGIEDFLHDIVQVVNLFSTKDYKIEGRLNDIEFKQYDIKGD